jgi:hypothetical protein
MGLKQIEEVIRKNIGKPVKIYWIDPASDWNNFIIDQFDKFSYRSEVTLVGFDQNGAKHDGVPFKVSIDDIKSIKACHLGFSEIEFLMEKMGYEDL